MPLQRCCQLTELTTVLRLEGKSVQGPNGWDVQVTLANPAAARKAFLLFKQLLGARRLELKRVPKSRGRRTYSVCLPTAEGIEGELIRAASLRFSDAELTVPDRLCCRRSVLRAVLLCRGWFAEPERQHHMEITLSEDAAPYVAECFESLGISVRHGVKKSGRLLYVKDGDTLVEILSHIGAHSALLQFESVRIAKDVRNSINRVVNCETANVDKTVSAAMRQVEAIRKIDRELGLSNLSPKLQEVAQLRAKYPYASLNELAELTSPQVSRSTVLYRLRRLIKIADELPQRST